MSVSRAGLSLLLALSVVPAAWCDAPKKLLLVGQGPDGHPPATHEYVSGLEVLRKCLAGRKDVEIMTERGDEPWRNSCADMASPTSCRQGRQPAEGAVGVPPGHARYRLMIPRATSPRFMAANASLIWSRRHSRVTSSSSLRAPAR